MVVVMSQDLCDVPLYVVICGEYFQTSIPAHATYTTCFPLFTLPASLEYCPCQCGRWCFCVRPCPCLVRAVSVRVRAVFVLRSCPSTGMRGRPSAAGRLIDRENGISGRVA
ncbi:hypothetical protein E2C01_071604 [Portunus trituberculatus]|uniref:Uncharacterized protein n=1 Tax=Portunus trituberculatus TaxID=210409 RepID=A0A5B7I6M7_PORTR|nr:hypothetical protein [Portunus trituberculatus]